MFVNFKQIDDAGHDWNMLNPEVKDVIAEADKGLGELVQYMNRAVGTRRWALALTADHGQAPDPLESGAWPIGMDILLENITNHFDVPEEDLIDETRVTGLWLNETGLAAHGITKGELADYILNYRIEDDVSAVKTIPPEYASRKREPVFSAVFPSSALGRIMQCARHRAALN
jgi:hypothetical protein